MKVARRGVFVALLPCVFAALCLIPARPLGNVPCPGTDTEVTRIQAHLAQVERELRSRDVSALAPGPRAARAGHIEALRAYRLRGLFPHNHVVPERRPVFVDPHGT